jgi:hypothetical protein
LQLVSSTEQRVQVRFAKEKGVKVHLSTFESPSSIGAFDLRRGGLTSAKVPVSLSPTTLMGRGVKD